MNQFELPIKPDMHQVDIKTIRGIPSMTRAIFLSQELAGLEDKEICGPTGIVSDAATWSKMRLPGRGQPNFPHDKLLKYMDLTQTEIILFWLADQRGYYLTPKETELEIQLRHEREASVKLQSENALLRSLLVGRGS